MKNPKNINKLAKAAFEKTTNTKEGKKMFAKGRISKGNPIFLDDLGVFCHPDDCEMVDDFIFFRKKIEDRIDEKI